MSEPHAVERENRIKFVAQDRVRVEEEISFDAIPIDGTRRLGDLAALTPHFPTGCSEPACHVVLLQSAYRQVVEHLASDVSREHGGLLLGYETTMQRDPGPAKPTVVIVEAVAAKFTEGSPVRLNFTTETWREMDEEIGKKYGDKELIPRRVGWYHSHPKIQIFLSRWDLDVCTTFASRRYPVALVVDPIDHHGGFFIGGSGGYDAHNPQGFFEAHDVVVGRSLVEWTNLGGPEFPSSQGDGLDPPDQPPSPDSEPPDAVPSDPSLEQVSTTEQSSPGRRSFWSPYQLIPAALVCILAVAISFLWTALQESKRKLALAESKLQQPAPPTQKQPPQVQLEVQPLNSEVLPSGTVQFSALPTGIDHPRVDWTITPPSDGRIDNNGLYHAPSQIKNSRDVIVTAQIDGTTFYARTAVHLQPNPSYSIRPESPKLMVGKSVAFSIVPSGGAPIRLPAVTWRLNPKIGTISSDGHYVAPAQLKLNQNIQLTAIAANKVELAHITIQLQKAEADGSHVTAGLRGDTPPAGPGQVSAKPASAPLQSPLAQTDAKLSLDCGSGKSLRPGDKMRLTPALGGNPVDVTWKLNPAALGSISADGEYTAPDNIPANIVTITVVATARTDDKLTSSCTLKLEPQKNESND